MSIDSLFPLCASALVLVLASSHPAAPLGAATVGVLHTLTGDSPGDRFGASIAGIGDVDGDGCADVVIGAPQADPNGSSSGFARVVSGRDGHVLRTIEGDSAFDALGSSVAAAGDVDADGIPDWIAGAPRGEPAAGSAWVRSGASGAPIWTFAGAADGELFGQSVCGIGDADGDARADLAIGAPQSDAAGSNAGRVEIRSGATGNVLHVVHGQHFDLFGTSLAAVGDFDSDGRGDLLVGAPLSDTGAFNAGSAYVHSGRDGSVLAAFHGASIGDQLGQWVASAGDHDGDGRADVLLALPGADANGIDSGAVELRSGASGALLRRIPGSRAGLYIGLVASLGDVSGDGRPDVLVGAPSTASAGPEAGEAFVVLGSIGSSAARLAGRHAYDWFGAAVAGIGDTDGDGWPDLAVGAPIHDDVLNAPGYVQIVSGRGFGG